ncbi:dodecin family protein [Halorussus caseinilyticus]|uniref:Dodecin family protein n=2 Tax=Halorussus caseinilyticus TaxID=3034025 RepID=A0ABD5WM28_9EURY
MSQVPVRIGRATSDRRLETATRRYTNPVVPSLAMTAVKIIKVLGTSEEGWEQAAQEAVDQASKTIDDIHGVEVEDWTADVENGQIQEYKTTVEVAFPVHEQQG